MQKLIDTHAHLQFEKFNSDRDKVVKRNSDNLLAVINPGADLPSSEEGVKLAQRIDNFYAAVGVHPHHVSSWNDTYLPKLRALVEENKVVAVGEIGLDSHFYQGYPLPDLKTQEKILIPQIELAQEKDRPILFHCRKAYDELYNLLKNYPGLKGLIHCFMGDKKTAEKFLSLNLFISFAGNLTYKDNEHMRQAAKFIPNDRLVIETDSPFLSPEPLRGQRNEPVNVSLVAEEIARIKGLTSEEVASFTTLNARTLFSI